MTLPVPASVANAATANTAPAPAVHPAVKARYWNWLQGVTPETRSLAWCHSTDAYALREILETGYLTPQRCPVFEESLLYFFYGRPAYRSTEARAIGCAAREPVVFVMGSELAGSAIRLFPFDSGAFNGGLYEKWMHRKMQLSCFELPPNFQGPERHVAAFFRSNEAYMTVSAVRPDPMPPGEHEVDCLARFLTDPVSQPADDRRCAVEMQVSGLVPVNEQSVLAIIIPSALKDARYVQEFQARTENKVEIICYLSNPLKQANEYQGLLEERVIDFYRKRGML